MMKYLSLTLALSSVAYCGDVLWSGIFDESATVADFDDCKLLTSTIAS